MSLFGINRLSSAGWPRRRAGWRPRAFPAALQPKLIPVEKIGAFIKDAICNQVWQTLEDIEAAITKELQPIWKIPEQVARLVGKEGWLASQLNVFARIQ